MVALVATIHVFAVFRPGTAEKIGSLVRDMLCLFRLPSAAQDVDGRDRPDHDGRANARAATLIAGIASQRQ